MRDFSRVTLKLFGMKLSLWLCIWRWLYWGCLTWSCILSNLLETIHTHDTNWSCTDRYWNWFLTSLSILIFESLCELHNCSSESVIVSILENIPTERSRRLSDSISESFIISFLHRRIYLCWFNHWEKSKEEEKERCKENPSQSKCFGKWDILECFPRKHRKKDKI